MKLKSESLEARLGSYGVAASALAALVPSAEAAVTSVTPANPLVYTTSPMEIDLDSDGSPEMSVSNMGIYSYYGSSYAYGNIKGLNGTKFQTSRRKTGVVDPLISSGYFGQGWATDFFIACATNSTLGFQFQKGGETQVGWLRCEVDNGTLKITDWAYQPATDGPIELGGIGNVAPYAYEDFSAVVDYEQKTGTYDAKFQVFPSEAAKLYYILSASDVAPALTDDGWSMADLSYGSAQKFPLTGIAAAGKSYVHYYLVDTEQVQSTLYTLEFQVDTDAPEFTIEGEDDYYGLNIINVTNSEAGWAYFLALPKDAPAPTLQELQNAKTAQFGGYITFANYGDQSFSIQGLDYGTSYTVYVVGSDRSGNYSEIQSIDIVGADNVAPEWTSAVLSTNNMLKVSANEDASVYCNVMDGSTNKTSFNLSLKANVASFYDLTSLKLADGAYTLNCYLNDTEGNQADRKTIALNITSDAQAPDALQWDVADVTASSALAKLIPDGDGSVYFQVLPATATAPTADELKALTAVTMTATESVEFTMSSLDENTAYKVYALLSDGTLDRILTNSFHTLDVTAPIATDAKLTDITAETALLSGTGNEDGVVFYQVAAASAETPTSSAVVAQSSGMAALALDKSYSTTVTGLSAATEYKVFVVVRDGSGNVSAVQTLALTTAPPVGVIGGQVANHTMDPSQPLHYAVFTTKGELLRQGVLPAGKELRSELKLAEGRYVVRSRQGSIMNTEIWLQNRQ